MDPALSSLIQFKTQKLHQTICIDTYKSKTKTKTKKNIENIQTCFSLYYTRVKISLIPSSSSSLMEPFESLFAFLVFFLYFGFSCSSSLIINNIDEFYNYTAISDFRVINRRSLIECPDPNPFLEINISSNSSLSDEEYVTVTVSGVLLPSEHDWVAMISPSHSE